MDSPAPRTVDASWPSRVAWPERLIEDGAILQRLPSADRRAPFWLLLNSVLLMFLRSQPPDLRADSEDELRDIASDKALDLMRSLDTGRWKPGLSSRGELILFLRRVARNGLVDHLRRRARIRTVQDDEWEQLPFARPQSSEAPSMELERERFVEALMGCLQTLTPKHRLIWFFRVCHELASRTIAAHPEIALKPQHVDVILQRTRGNVTECMARRGLRATDMPAGTFATLWEALRWVDPYANEVGEDG